MKRSAIWATIVTLSIAVHAQPTAKRTRALPIEVYENIVFVPVTVGTHKLSFLLATGSPYSAIDADAVAALGLETEKAGKTTYTAAIKLDVSGDPFQARLAVADFAPVVRSIGRPFSGVLGFDYFRDRVIEIDYDSAVAWVADPVSFKYSGVGECIGLEISQNRPRFSAKLKMPGTGEVEKQYVLDTGMGGAIADDVFKNLGREPIGPDLGRADYLKFGSFTFEGANGTAGNSSVGAEIWHRFNLTLNVPHQQACLEANRHFRDALMFDTSGLEIEQVEGGLRVVQVYPRSPALSAGIKIGDLIVEIDSLSATHLGADRVWKMFHYVRPHQLKIRRGEQTLSVTLQLKKML